MRILNSLLVPKNVKGGLFEILQPPFFCETSKNERVPLETLKISRKKKKQKMRILNSLIVLNNLKGALWVVKTSTLLQEISKHELVPFADIKKNHKAGKRHKSVPEGRDL